MSRFPALTTEEAERERRRRQDELALLLLAFTWDAETLGYYTPAGRRVPEKTVRRAVNAVVEATRADVAALSRQVTAGEIDVAEWQDAIGRRLKTMHTATSAAAAGGFENMSPAAVARLEGLLAFHVEKLEGFAEDVSRGYTTLRSVQVVSETGELQEVTRVVRMTERLVVARSEMYALAGASDGYEGGRRQAATEVGYRYERNILHPADHCAECVNQTGRGWVDIGLLVPVGERTCLTRCVCSLQFARDIPA